MTFIATKILESIEIELQRVHQAKSLRNSCKSKDRKQRKNRVIAKTTD